jgi:hypothetical protein
MLIPKRAKLFKERELAIFTKSKTDRLDAKRDIP